MLFPRAVFPFRHLVCAVCLLCALALSGCARNALHLAYPEHSKLAVPSASASSVCVVEFSDERGKLEIGEYRNGTFAHAGSPVTAWLARALAEELAAEGFIVSYAATLEEAILSAPDHIITGSVDEVWLQESGMTKYSCSIRCTLSLLAPDGIRLFRNSLSAKVTRSTLPLIGNGEAALTEAAQEFIQPAARLIGEKLR